MAAAPPEQAEITIDIPIDQVPPWLGELLFRGAGAAWPRVSLRIDRARLAEPVEVTNDMGGAFHFKATLYADGVGFTQA